MESWQERSGEVWACGDGSNGQLGVAAVDGGAESMPRSQAPVKVEVLAGEHIRSVACGDRHSAAVSTGGTLFTWGDGEMGQLARDDVFSVPRPVTHLSGVKVHKVSCGIEHTICLTDAGEVVAWGDNSCGQLGLGTDGSGNGVSFSVPCVVKSLSGKGIVTVACGNRSAVALSRRGDVFVWGDGSKGQLACQTKQSGVPLLVAGLAGLPITDVSAGGNHCFAVSASGIAYSWGCGSSGQLGLGGTEDRFEVTQNRYLRGKAIVKVSCGGSHTAALGRSGTLYTFGSGSAGQLGHGDAENVLVPKPVAHFDGMRIVDVDCGRQFTVAIRAKEGSAATVTYAWGSGLCGQLGHGDADSRSTPSAITSFIGSGLSVLSVACGGEHTVFIASPIAEGNAAQVPGAHAVVGQAPIDFFDAAVVDALSGDLPELLKGIENVFSSPSCLNASFLLREEVLRTGPSHSGLDTEAVRRAYVKFMSLGSDAVYNTLLRASAAALASLVDSPPVTHEGLRAIIVLLQNPLLMNTTEVNAAVVGRAAAAIASLVPPMKAALIDWWSRLPREIFSEIVETMRSSLCFFLPSGFNPANVLATLAMLYEANESGRLILYTSFYSSLVSSHMDIAHEYQLWRGPESYTCFLHYPFLLDPVAKSAVFQYDSLIQQRASSFFGNLVLSFCVRRSHIIEDALSELASIKTPSALKCEMKVSFLGEAAVDEGGVRKEFFQLAMRRVLDPEFGMFVVNTDSDTHWFNVSSEEGSAKYHLVGVLMGLAIYNRVLLDVRFPGIVYRMLLGGAPTLRDLSAGWPTLGKNLQKLLDYTGNVEEDFSLSFTWTYLHNGETRVVELKQNGASIPVTNDNRSEYVSLIVDYVCAGSVRAQFDAFLRGFALVTAGPALSLFRPEELENLICGEITTDIDLTQLQEVCLYEGGYHADHPTIIMFWEVANGLSCELKKKLLFFSTGGDRIPVGGLRSMRFTIQRAGPDTTSLPTASTCHNILLLPEYSVKEKLKDRLITAIQWCEGFGLM